MMSKNNLSKQEIPRVTERLEDWEYLISFSKIEFEQIPEKDLLEVCRSYVVRVLLEQSSRPFRDFMLMYGRYDAIKSESGWEALREYFKKLQTCLNNEIARLQEILSEMSNNSNLGANTELIVFKGIVHVIFNADSNKFEMRFLPDGYKAGEEIDFDMDCALLTSQYAEVLSYLLQELPKERLKLCGYSKCNTPFFQTTARGKNFCSEICAKKGSQAKYMEKRLKGSNSE